MILNAIVRVPGTFSGIIDTALTVGCRRQTDRQSLRFASTAHSRQSENIGVLPRVESKTHQEILNAACAFKVFPAIHSARTMRRRIEMKAITLMAALVVCSVASNVQAGLFGHFKGNHGCGCSVEPTCCAPVEASCCAPAGCDNGCGPAVEPTCCAPAACGPAVEPTCCAPAACGTACEPTCCAPVETCGSACNTCGDSCGCNSGCGSSCFKMPKFKMPKFKMPKFKLPKCNLFGGCGSSCGSSCCSEPSCCAPAACGAACEPTCCAPVEPSCCAPVAGGCN